MLTLLIYITEVGCLIDHEVFRCAINDKDKKHQLFIQSFFLKIHYLPLTIPMYLPDRH